MRIPFFVLPPTCMGLGFASAVYTGSTINILHVALVLVGAVLAHISVNALNEYDDFKTGLDFKTSQTPFSGGRKAIPETPEKAHHAIITGIVSLSVKAVVRFIDIHLFDDLLLQPRPSALCPESNIQFDIYLAVIDIDLGQ